MTTTLVVPDWIATMLVTAAANPLETAGVLLATRMDLGSGQVRLLAQALQMVPDVDYLERHGDRLAIRSTGWVPALADAERLGATPIWFHTHPGDTAVPLPSNADHEVDKAVADLFRLRSGADDYGTLIVSPRPAGLAFSGTLQPAAGPRLQIDRLWEIGNRWRLTRAFDSDCRPLEPIFDRNIRAFGTAIQETLSDLAVGIVGCGGTGSALAEQLVRLGVRDLRIVDGDTLSPSNVTRVYGSTPQDVGRSKPDILRAHLAKIAPDLRCEANAGRITQERVAQSFADRDLIFGCTDDNAGRLILSRMATYLMVPLVDLGVLIDSDEAGLLTGIHGRVTTLLPGAACLVCRDRIDLQRAAVELRNPDERQRLEDEGYAPALGQTEPAVVAYTTMVAAAAVNELLDRLVSFGPQPQPSEILIRVHDREISGNRADPRPGHYCDRITGKLGFGPGTPFLEQAWIGE